jgi:hypothetical protein
MLDLLTRLVGAILYGNAIYTFGSILVAAATTVRSYKFMIVGRVILALGDIATQIAQYKIFSSWFPPNHGFASTLGLELGIGKVCLHQRRSNTALTLCPDRGFCRKVNSQYHRHGTYRELQICAHVTNVIQRTLEIFPGFSGSLSS